MKVLIADDEETERKALCSILQGEPNIEIFEFSNGQQALDALCDKLDPDLCLVDIRMPEMDGLELLQKVRREPTLRNLKVVISSANRDRNIILALAQLGISGYLLKPFVPDKVLEIIKPILASIEATKATKLPAERDLLSKTLLIVDDDRDMRDVLKAAATLEKWKVVEAADGEEALAKLRAGLLPDLCFADVMMPRKDGITFVKEAREIPSLSKMPIVIISSEHRVETIRSLAGQHISAYILKPFDLKKIKFMLQQGVQQPNTKDEKAGAAEAAPAETEKPAEEPPPSA